MSSTQPRVKEEIPCCFTSPTSPLQIFICTIAFGIGVDTPDVRHIVHFGPPYNLVDYIPGVGRSGRDGQTAYTFLLCGKGLRRHIDDQISSYCDNKDICRQDMLFSDFDCYSHSPINTGCKCCDLRALKCGKCSKSQVLLVQHI